MRGETKRGCRLCVTEERTRHLCEGASCMACYKRQHNNNCPVWLVDLSFVINFVKQMQKNVDDLQIKENSQISMNE